MTTQPFAGIDARARQALRRLRLQLDRLAVAPGSGTTRSREGGRGLEFDQVVPYAYGDDIRDIDWNVTARLGAMYRKTFVEDRESSLVCVLGDHPALRFGTGSTTKRDRLLDVLSLLLLFALEQQQKASLLHLRGSAVETLPFTRDRGRVLRTIARLFGEAPPELSSPASPAPPVELLQRLGRGHVLLWLGEIPEEDPPPAWLDVCRRHSTLAIRVEDRWEREFPEAPLVAFDPVAQALVDLPGGREGAAQHAAWRNDRERRWVRWWPRSDQRLVIDNEDGSDTFLALSDFLGRRRDLVRRPVG
jgi:uncharacterized protein (DUF58 family)